MSVIATGPPNIYQVIKWTCTDVQQCFFSGVSIVLNCVLGVYIYKYMYIYNFINQLTKTFTQNYNYLKCI